MKKLLCILLSLLMVFSVVTVAFAKEKEEEEEEEEVNLIDNLSDLLSDQNIIGVFDGKNLTMPATLDNYKVGDGYDMNRIINEGKLDGVYFLGMNLGFLYTKNDFLDWGRLSVSHNDVANLYGQIDQYLGYLIRSRYEYEEKLCTAPIATSICNLIGRMFIANYQNKTIRFDTDHVTSLEFYKKIAVESGLGDLIQRAWCANYDVELYRPFLINVLGVDLTDLEAIRYFTEYGKEWLHGEELAAYMIKSVIEGAFHNNPLTFFMTGLKNLLYGYDFNMFQAIKGLMSDKINNGDVTEEKLHSFDELLKALSKNSGQTNAAEFIPVPVFRYSNARDYTEMFLYLLIYLNLLGKHMNNKTAINNFKNKATRSLGGTDRDVVNGIFDALFFSDLSGLVRLMPTMVHDNLDNVGNNLWITFTRTMSRMVRTITDFFDRIYQAFRNGFYLDRYINI